jgi:hypothetical protein
LTSSKRPLKVFLSHAHSDAEAVRALYDRLTADGVDAWLDKENLLPGQDWELEIRKAVREADVVVVCLSKGFNQRGYRQKEVRIALDEAEMMPEGEIFIIPARLEECDTLESLRKWQWVDLFAQNGYEKLLRSLNLRARNIVAEITERELKGPILHDISKGIKTQIQFGLYSDAYKKCIALLANEVSLPLINLLAGIAYTLDKGENKLRDSDMQIINKHISLAINDNETKPTALAVLGCVKHGYYHLNKIYDPSNLTLESIKKELQKCSTPIDNELLYLIDPTEYALSFLGIQ